MNARKQLIVSIAYHMGGGYQIDRQTLQSLAKKAGVSERTAYRAKYDVETTIIMTPYEM